MTMKRLMVLDFVDLISNQNSTTLSTSNYLCNIYIYIFVACPLPILNAFLLCSGNASGLFVRDGTRVSPTPSTRIDRPMSEVLCNTYIYIYIRDCLCDVNHTVNTVHTFFAP